MKVSNNALNFLLAQYRAIFKRAYVKGLASAVLLTAGLAAGASQAQAADIDDGAADNLANGELTLIVGSGSGSETTKYYDKFNISGGTPASWNAEVIVQSGTTSESKIAGTNAAVSITGSGSLKIDIADGTVAKGLSIEAGSNGATVSIDSIAVNTGTLKVTDAANKEAKVEATSITIGAPASQVPNEPAVAATNEYKSILDLTASGNGGTLTFGKAGTTDITVNGSGKIQVTAGSGTATINGKTLTLNDKAMFLSKNDGNNAASTSTLAVDNLTELAGAFHIVSGSASHTLTQEFTGKTASFGGNLLITKDATLDLQTQLATGTGTGDIDGQGIVTLDNSSNTVLGGTLKVSSGTLAVAADAKLNASVEGAAIAVAGTSASKSTLEISSSTLKQFLKGGADYKDIKIEGTTVDAADDSKKGAVTIASGTLRFTDADVNLSEFAFKGDASASTANAGQITFKSGDATTIEGQNFTIEKKLDENTDGTDSGIEIKATSLSLGNGKAAVDDYGFKKATVANLYNTATGEITLGNEVTLDVTLGGNSVVGSETGEVTGNFVVTQNGPLTFKHGTYNPDSDITISGGTLTVTNGTIGDGSVKVDTKVTLDQKLTLDNSVQGTKISVDGDDVSGATTVLDITKAELVFDAGTKTAAIEAVDGGVIIAKGDQLNQLLKDFSTGSGNTSGASITAANLVTTKNNC